MSVPLNPRVVAVAPEPSYQLMLTFDNGMQRRFDARPYLKAPVFGRLSDPSYFSAVKADHGTVMWPDQEDFCPDTLWLQSQPLV